MTLDEITLEILEEQLLIVSRLKRFYPKLKEFVHQIFQL